MRPIQRTVLTAAILLALGMTTCTVVRADDRDYDETAWMQMRAAKRQQVRDLCALWLPMYRPQAVGKTYGDLADACAAIPVSQCSPALRQHLKLAERHCTEIHELSALGGSLPGLIDLLAAAKSGTLDSNTVPSARGHRILELLRELAASEIRLIEQGLVRRGAGMPGED